MNESQYVRFNPNPILDPLVNNWQDFRNEFVAYLPTHIGDTGLVDPNTPGTKPVLPNLYQYKKEMSYDGGIFKSMTLFIRDSLLDDREAKPLNWHNFQKGGPKFFYNWQRALQLPLMKSWLEKHIDIIGSVQYNVCTGGSHLKHHWGLDYNYLRLHLVLKSAPGAKFDIENEVHEWTDGELFGFDDSMVLHGTKHFGTEPRTVILIDILKDAVQPYAKNWPIKPWQPRSERPKIEITSW